MSAEFYLAKRYLLNHRHGAWGWLISWMTTGSVALGVAALIVTLAVMTGFRDDISRKILGVQPHVIISPVSGEIDPSSPRIASVLNSEKNVVAWSPYVSGQVLMGHGSQNSGAMIKGVDPAREPDVSNLREKITVGKWSDLNAGAPSGTPRPGIILGQELARNLGARQGDTVWLVTPGSIGLTALSIPRAHLFTVVGIIQTGLYDYDSSLAYIDLTAARRVFDLEKNVTGIGIRVRDPDRADLVASELTVKFQGDYWIRSWLALNRNLFSALKLEKMVMFTILIMVTLVASFMIVSNLLLSITQKVKEIGILRAMGATGASIRRTFLYQGLLMGAVGTTIGVVLGLAISLFLAHTNIIRLPADVYYIDRLPIQIELGDVAAVVLAAGLIVLAATLYPAHRATKLDPLDAIRYG
jgi:lipoprotein-releasing system permease protein